MSNKLKRSLPAWAGILAFYLGMQFFVDRHLPTGHPPAIAGNSLDGKVLDLSQLRGQPAVIYFWASWCGICNAMRSGMRAVAADHPFISVAVQSGKADEVRQFQQEHGFLPPTLLDEDGALSKQYGLRGVPAVFVLDPEGKIRYSSVGYTSEWGLRARLWLAGR